MAAAASDLNSSDRGVALQAGLVRASEDTQMGLVPPEFATRIDIITEGRPSVVHCLCQNSADGRVQPPNLGRPQAACGPLRVQLGDKERLVSVDVTDACCDSLVEQNGLQFRAAFRQGVDKPFRCKVLPKRFWPQATYY